MKAYKSLLLSGTGLILLVIFGCAALTQYGKLEKSARQYYIRGSYDMAVFDCARALKINPNYEKAQLLIQDAFRAAVNSHENKLAELKPSKAKFKWDDIVSEYEALIQLNKVVKELPTLRVKKTKEVIKFEITDYSENLAEAKTNAAEAHYQEGLVLSEKEGVDIQKQAAKEFKAAMVFISEYKDAGTLYERARTAGIKRMAIIPFEDKSGKGRKYGDLSGMIVDDIVSDVMNDPSAMEFLEIISRDQLELVMQEQALGQTGILDEKSAVELARILGVHEILTGKMTQIIYTPSNTVSKNVRQESKVVVGEEKYKDSKGKTRTRNVYGNVNATATIYTRTTSAKIAGSYKMIDVKTAKLKKSASFTGNSNFKHEWATFRGDERALDRDVSRLASESEKPAPVEEEMVNGAAKNLARSLSMTLKEYAR
ncbi:MAG: hypothetical protein H8E10_20825 [Desulfobacterales bacterium]|nr:hypothetical protein [Desulfobacterales bacterium]